jgi:hypothetical protein
VQVEERTLCVAEIPAVRYYSLQFSNPYSVEIDVIVMVSICGFCLTECAVDPVRKRRWFSCGCGKCDPSSGAMDESSFAQDVPETTDGMVESFPLEQDQMSLWRWEEWMEGQDGAHVGPALMKMMASVLSMMLPKKAGNCAGNCGWDVQMEAKKRMEKWVRSAIECFDWEAMGEVEALVFFSWVMSGVFLELFDIKMLELQKIGQDGAIISSFHDIALQREKRRKEVEFHQVEDIDVDGKETTSPIDDDVQLETTMSDERISSVHVVDSVDSIRLSCMDQISEWMGVLHESKADESMEVESVCLTIFHHILKNTHKYACVCMYMLSFRSVLLFLNPRLPLLLLFLVVCGE